MIELSGITISDNMYLTGITEARQVSVQQKRSVEGVSNLSVYPNIGGRVLSLGSNLEEGSIQGVWCKQVIDEIKAIEVLRLPQQLNYHGTIYTVMIVDTSGFTPLFKNETESLSKKYTGYITLIEV